MSYIMLPAMLLISTSRWPVFYLYLEYLFHFIFRYVIKSVYQWTILYLTLVTGVSTGHFNAWKEDLHHLCLRVGRYWFWHSWEVQKILLPLGFDHRTLQTAASHHTTYVIPVAAKLLNHANNIKWILLITNSLHRLNPSVEGNTTSQHTMV
jgi:hypothetical protein